MLDPGEDDDMWNRIAHQNLTVARYSESVARYFMLGHKKEKANSQRIKVLHSGHKVFDTDGINNLQ